MERAEWLKQMRNMAESLYDHIAPDYWVRFGMDIDEAHQEFMRRFLARVGPPGLILSAACGAGRFEGMLLEAGHRVVGIDQSEGMLARARARYPPEQFPGVRYEQIGLQEMDFPAEFDGAICLDALEHICPEDWPGILRGFQAALKPGAPLYFTLDYRDVGELKAAYENALAQGLPVIYGEVADEVEAAYRRALETGEVLDQCVYHYCPPLEQVHSWLEQAGLAVVETGLESDYLHIIVKKAAPAFS